MGVKKIKGANRFIDKPKEDLPFYERFRFWVDENTNKILAAAGVLVALSLIFWGVSAYRERGQKLAAVEYAQLLAELPDSRSDAAAAWEALVPEFQKFVESHSGKRAALSAQLDLAEALYRTGKYEEAAGWCARVIEEAPAGNGLKLLATYQLALISEAHGKGRDALAQWSAVKAEGTQALNREADWHLARFYLAGQDYPGAVERYDQAIKEAGPYPATSLLEEEMSSAKSKAGSQSGKDKQETRKEDSKS